MNFLLSLRGKSKRSIVDPVFGSLQHKNGSWSGQVTWPHRPSIISVHVDRRLDDPAESDRVAFQSLCDNYLALAPAIEDALFDLWTSFLQDADWEGPRPATARDLFNILVFDGAVINPDGKIELLYGFAGDVWPDALFSVSVNGKNVEPISLDD